VGEVRRRTISKVANFAVIKAVAEYLAPLQVGVGVRGGTDAIIHSIQFFLDKGGTNGEALLKVDLTNAFNLVDRTKMFEAVMAHCPSILPWVQSVYGGAPLLFLGPSAIIESQVGVQQGDPLGPLLFALTIQPLLVKATSELTVNLSVGVFYADDGTLVGPPDALKQVLEILRDDGPDFGVFLNLGKSALWDLNQQTDLTPLEAFQLIDCEDGVDLLGSFLGDDLLADQYALKRVEAIRSIVEELHHLNDKQMAFHLFQQCIGMPRFNYTLRTLHPSRIPLSIAAFDALVADTLVWLCGSRDLDEWHLNRATLPISLSGTGCISASRIAFPSYVASRADTLFLQSAILKHPTTEFLLEDFSVLYSQFTTSITSPFTLTNKQFLDSEDRQSVLVSAVHNLAYEALLSTPHISPRDKAVAMACSMDSGDFLMSIPSFSSPALSSSEFSVALSHRCGLPIYRQTAQCPCCRLELDVFGEHAIQCAAKVDDSAQERILRHNSVCSVLQQAGRDAGFSVSMEPRHILTDGTNSKPADVLFSRFKDMRDLAVDVHIRHSLSHVCENRPFDPSEILIQGENDKNRRYLAKCTEASISFAPFVMGTFGGFGPAAKKLMNSIVEGQAAQIGFSSYTEAELLRFLRQKMSMAVARVQADAIISRGVAAGVLGSVDDEPRD
jgi:hypothetical protein